MVEKAYFRSKHKAGSNINPEFQVPCKGSLYYKSKSHEIRLILQEPLSPLTTLPPHPHTSKDILVRRTLSTSSIAMVCVFFSELNIL